MPRRSTTPTSSLARRTKAPGVHAQAFDEGGASFVHLVFLVVIAGLHGPQSRAWASAQARVRCARKHVSALDQAGHLLAFGLFGEGAGLAVVVVAHGLQPHLVGHPSSASIAAERRRRLPRRQSGVRSGAGFAVRAGLAARSWQCSWSGPQHPGGAPGRATTAAFRGPPPCKRS